jgi:CheY-like chemotaxis protein
MSKKILAVDDSKMMLRIITGTIEMLPLKASNGKEDSALLEKEGSNVAPALLDLNGMETLEAIKADPRFSSIPVIMVTQSTGLGCENHGMLGCG